MSSDIQFGDLEESEPEQALRPDQDAHFATAMVDDVGDEELLIFVDLDVMRDMEAHARSNTRVELGGVMLGRQAIDDQGRPFVLITDSLRAEHYEATKGSFKFTHETWSQITRQRDNFRPDLEMVGWYHTHPGWSVFLSGMDLFICNNFFNRPLDVALVIDPCEQDRGWFQWIDSKTTQRTGGFVMMTSRFRQLELDQFASIYNKEPIMNVDPRYSGNPLAGSTQSSVTLMDNRKPVYELVVIGMLMTQFLFFVLMAWQIFGSNGSELQTAEKEKIEQLESQIQKMAIDQGRSMREQTYHEILDTLVTSQTGDKNLVDDFQKLKTEQKRMQANLEGQLALSEKLTGQRIESERNLKLKTKDADSLEKQLVDTRLKLKASDEQLATLTADLPEANVGLFSYALKTPWWWLVIGAGVVGLLGTALGFAIGRREELYDSDRSNFDPQSPDNFGQRAQTFGSGPDQQPSLAPDASPKATGVPDSGNLNLDQRSIHPEPDPQAEPPIKVVSSRGDNLPLKLDGDSTPPREPR